ncbi:MAG TPA: hypothetical protein PKE27_01200 [Povalibacter sp.]|uniref:hypothetical protein n=1 Tax=Povalibacter sp. TaxID=1962978 RepID=UPI002B8DC684|nr:hypothetical protein [Povalibacter sp.]HMN43165.1 hypothetical protein [Povalibacter sp.]
MKLERISALVQARPLQGRHDRLPAPGESLLLTYGEAAGDGHLATLSNGMTLRVPVPAQWQRSLQAGDALRVRVLANEPVLELEVEAGPIRSGASAARVQEEGAAAVTRQAAMRLDQAALRQMAWQAPDAAALAQSWRDLALARWGARLSVQSAVTMMGPAPFREPAAVAPPASPLNYWLFPVYAWGGVQVLLGLVRTEEHARRQRQRGLRGPVLCVEFAPQALGPVVVRVQWLPGGIDLEIALARSHAAQPVRNALSRIVQALERAGVRLTQLRLVCGETQIARLGDPLDQGPQSHRTAPRSSRALFRTLSEATVVLLQVVPAIGQ